MRETNEPNNGGYPQYYNQNPYNGYPPPKKSGNGGLIALISILSCIIVIGIVVLTLMFTGVISFGGSNQEAASVTTAAPTPEPAAAVPPAAPAAPPAYQASANTTISSYMYVANVKYSIYFRNAPIENDSNIICEIPLGTMIGYIEPADGVFSKINYNGSIGYVKTQYLSASSPSTSYSRSNTMTVVNVKHSIYLRSTPYETSGNIIMEIPVGSTVTYLGTPNGTFYQISYGGTVGYSKQEYLAFN